MTYFNFGLLIINFLAFSLYPSLNIPREPLHILKVKIDEFIPLIPVFVIPYASFYFFLIFTIFSFAAKQHAKELHIILSTMLLTICLSDLIYVLFQTQIIRPTIYQSDPFSKVLSFIYSIDQPYNAFPSIHTSLSAIGVLAWIRRKGRYSNLAVCWAITIIISTVLVKQHYTLDIFGGLILAILSFTLVLKLNLLRNYFRIHL